MIRAALIIACAGAAVFFWLLVFSALGNGAAAHHPVGVAIAALDAMALSTVAIALWETRR